MKTQENSSKHVIIIGNGIAGVTAAITIRKLSDYCITVISGENEHFYARTALMYLYLGQLRYENIKPYEDWFWQENRIELRHAWVNRIEFEEKTLILASGETLAYDKLLLATGSQTAFYNWPGQESKGVHGFYDLEDLAKIEKATQRGGKAILVGGGLIAVELAEMLHSRNIDTTILIRDAHYWGKNLPKAEAEMVRKRLEQKGINLLFKTTLEQLEQDSEGWVCAAITNEQERIPCTFVGIATGVQPNLELVKNGSINTQKGILVDQFLETNIPEVFAAGDCAELAFAENRIEQIWYTGRIQGETAGYNICGHQVPYERGVPFNSAKFFDLEFQTYGSVNPEVNTEESSLFWQNEAGTASIRINYLKDELKTVTGFVLLNVRYRQEVCETWIREQKPLEYVMKHLKEANFDPEFHRRHEKSIQHVYKSGN
ncbi:NAD(P)/FAD-dependent oxidoreductase [Adhaeribacter soli]|uniref:NAD(P)/FAD-dependent oxidoreductase n=1 Tax=Adhaeribacter soli TaxID=2607655 RepID=A0A5N1J733_9BACT|nr:FAD/NAD(P)-binding oxidoreductase [Adhaeribacter soli]KAA9345923.1 NAD(P)/FAD-dependent oxidoreductase [Adhaeribacter soli]